jgi:hypothetical protein
MDRPSVDRTRFDRYVERLAEVVTALAAGGISDGPALVQRTEERGADGCGRSTRSRWVVPSNFYITSWRRRPGMIERFSAWPGTMLLRSWSGTPRLEQWVVDDTAIPKKGKHSVGVTRHYCSVLGKQEGLPPAPVVADAGYGDVTGFRESSSARFDGGSSGIIRSSRMSWDSITTRDGDGGGSTITASCAWPPTVSWRPNAAAFSPLRLLPSSSPLR